MELELELLSGTYELNGIGIRGAIGIGIQFFGIIYTTGVQYIVGINLGG